MPHNMTNSEATELSPLCLSDGPESADIRLPLGSLREQVGCATRYLHLSNYHRDRVLRVAMRAALEIEKASSWLNAQSNSAGLYIRPNFLDGNTHGAMVEERFVKNASSRDCLVSVRLGGIPLLIGIANRLVTLSDEDDYSGFVQSVFNPRPDQIKWDPEREPIGILTFTMAPDDDNGFDKTADIVINALLMIFFHEASHACAAHAFVAHKWRNSSRYREYHRALEAEADWGAGLLFLKYQYQSSQGMVPDKSAICQDLIFGARCNFIALQAALGLKGGSENYHYPRTRMFCTVAGARQAWNSLGFTNQEFDNLVAEASSPFMMEEIAFPVGVKGWLYEGDARSIADHDALNAETLALWIMLRGSHDYKRVPPLDEFYVRISRY